MTIRINEPPAEVILWGGTGQAKVVRPIFHRLGARVIAVFDDTPSLAPPFADVPLYHGSEFAGWRARHPGQIGFCVAIGNPHGRVRIRIHERLAAEGLVPTTIAHPTAFIEDNATIGEGSQLMAGAFVGAEARLGRQCIINTKASVDHEDVLADGVEIAPGATLCGLVHIGVNGWVCAGATVLPRIRIGEDAIVGAGAVVTKHVADGTKVVGVPARPMPAKESAR